MKKKAVAAAMIAAMMVCTTAQAKVDYSDLEDMTIGELQALQEEISGRLIDMGADETADADSASGANKEAGTGAESSEAGEAPEAGNKEEAGEIPETGEKKEAPGETKDDAQEEEPDSLAPDENGAIIFDEIGESLLLDDEWAAVKLTSFFQQANETRMEKGITLSVTNKSNREFNLRTYMANLGSESAGIKEMVPHGNLLPGQSEIYTYFITRKTADGAEEIPASIDELYSLNGQFILDVMTEDKSSFDRSQRQQILFDFKELPAGKIFRPEDPDKKKEAGPPKEAGEGASPDGSASPQASQGNAAPQGNASPQPSDGNASPEAPQGNAAAQPSEGSASPQAPTENAAPQPSDGNASPQAPQEAAPADTSAKAQVPENVNIPVKEDGNLTLESKGGSILYKDAIINTKNFHTSEGTTADALVLRFEYTNKGTDTKQYYADFQITVSQNNVNLDVAGSWNVDEDFPVEVNDCYMPVAGGQTIYFGLPFMLMDDSPVTIAVSAVGGSANGETASMELQLK